MVITLVLVMAGFVLIQAVMLIVTLLLTQQRLESLNQQLQTLSDTADRGLKLSHRVLDVVETALENLPTLEDVTKRKLETLTEATQKMDRSIAQTAATVRSEVAQASDVVDTTLSRFSLQTFRLHQVLVDPAVRLSSLFQSGVAVLRRVLSHQQRPPDSHSPDKEIFI